MLQVPYPTILFQVMSNLAFIEDNHTFGSMAAIHLKMVSNEPSHYILLLHFENSVSCKDSNH
jgi:hypothetical protein